MTAAAASRARPTRWYRKQDAPRTVLLYVCFALFAVWVLAPIYFVVHSSFSTAGEMAAQPPNWIPRHPTLDNLSLIHI